MDAMLAGSAAACATPAPPRPAEPSSPATIPSPGPATTEAAPAPSEAPAPAPSVEPSPEKAPAPARYEVPADKVADCADGFRNVLSDLRAAEAWDYAELRQRFDATNARPLLASGNVCRTAADQDGCHRELARAGSVGFGSSCHPAHCDFHLVVTDGSGVRRLGSPAEVRRFLGPIDTPGEALLMAFVHGHWVLGCDEPAPRRSGGGWRVTVNQTIEECPIVTADVTIGIAADGTVQVLSTANRKQTNACVGRRPPGLRDEGIDASASIGDYLAASAHLEAASVPAFERLRRELSALGAPANLLRACTRAVYDERRHAREMRRLAVAHGRDVPKVRLRRVRQRAPEELALDNAVEGCVRETFGAVVGLYQAHAARQAQVRDTLARIAQDEIEHAALAWKIAAWLEPRLSASARRSVRAAQRRALAELRAELAIEPDASLQSELGLPSSVAALQALEVLEQTLFDQPRARPLKGSWRSAPSGMPASTS